MDEKMKLAWIAGYVNGLIKDLEEVKEKKDWYPKDAEIQFEKLKTIEKQLKAVKEKAEG